MVVSHMYPTVLEAFCPYLEYCRTAIRRDALIQKLDKLLYVHILDTYFHPNQKHIYIGLLFHGMSKL